MLLVFGIALWGFASGSPLMRPKTSIAGDTQTHRPAHAQPVDRLAPNDALPVTSDVFPLPDVPYDLQVNE